MCYLLSLAPYTVFIKPPFEKEIDLALETFLPVHPHHKLSFRLVDETRALPAPWDKDPANPPGPCLQIPHPAGLKLHARQATFDKSGASSVRSGIHISILGSVGALVPKRPL